MYSSYSNVTSVQVELQHKLSVGIYNSDHEI